GELGRLRGGVARLVAPTGGGLAGAHGIARVSSLLLRPPLRPVRAGAARRHSAPPAQLRRYAACARASLAASSMSLAGTSRRRRASARQAEASKRCTASSRGSPSLTYALSRAWKPPWPLSGAMTLRLSITSWGMRNVTGTILRSREGRVFRD